MSNLKYMIILLSSLLFASSCGIKQRNTPFLKPGEKTILESTSTDTETIINLTSQSPSFLHISIEENGDPLAQTDNTSIEAYGDTLQNQLLSTISLDKKEQDPNCTPELFGIDKTSVLGDIFLCKTNIRLSDIKLWVLNSPGKKPIQATNYIINNIDEEKVSITLNFH